MSVSLYTVMPSHINLALISTGITLNTASLSGTPDAAASPPRRAAVLANSGLRELTCDVGHDGGAAPQDKRSVPAEEVLAKVRVSTVPQGAGVGQLVHPFLSHPAELVKETLNVVAAALPIPRRARQLLAPPSLDTWRRDAVTIHLRHTPDY